MQLHSVLFFSSSAIRASKASILACISASFASQSQAPDELPQEPEEELPPGTEPPGIEPPGTEPPGVEPPPDEELPPELPPEEEEPAFELLPPAEADGVLLPESSAESAEPEATPEPEAEPEADPEAEPEAESESEEPFADSEAIEAEALADAESLSDAVSYPGHEGL